MDSFPVVKTIDLATEWASSRQTTVEVFPAAIRATITNMTMRLTNPSVTDGQRPELQFTLKASTDDEERPQVIWTEDVAFPDYGRQVEFSERRALPEFLSKLEIDLYRKRGVAGQFGTLTLVAWFDRESSNG